MWVLMTEVPYVMGTIDYMSPEQARGQVLDQRTDVFSFGVACEMAAGHIPFSGATSADALVAILDKEPPPLAKSAPDTPVEFERIMSKALRKDREERYQTIKDLLIDLKSLKEELAFAQKLDRSRAPQSRVGPAIKPAAESLTTNQQAAAATDARLVQKSVSRKGRTLAVALVVIVLAALGIGGAMLWRRRTSTPLASNPAPTVQRAIRYWIMVQKISRRQTVSRTIQAQGRHQL